MAETKTTTRGERTNETGRALARNRDRSAFQSMQPRGGWVSSPFELMDRMTDEMDRLFDRMFRDVGGAPRRSWLSRGERLSHGFWAPRVEAFQKGDQFIVRAELPGLKKDEVQVEVTDDAITIQGQRREERQQEEREGFYHSELEYGEFYRTIPLPDGVIADSAKAAFRDGVLEIRMQAPPAEATRGRRLEITESSGEGERGKS